MSGHHWDREGLLLSAGAAGGLDSLQIQQVHGQKPAFRIFIPKGLSHSPKAAASPPSDLQAPGTCLHRVATEKQNLDPDFSGRAKVESIKLQIR